MATLNDVKALAGQLGITFNDHDQAFDLDSQSNAPLRFEGTYRKVQAGIDGAYDSLVKHQTNLRNYQTSDRCRSTRRRGGIGTSGAFLLFFLATLVTYTIGTIYPETRGITGPLTILFTILIVLSAVMLALAHSRK